MFNWFKKDPKKKEIELETKLQEFISKYQEYFNSYAFTGKEFIIYKEPEIKDGELIMNYIDHTTPAGFTKYKPIWWFSAMYDCDFIKTHRHNYVILKDRLQKLGIELKKIEE